MRKFPLQWPRTQKRRLDHGWAWQRDETNKKIDATTAHFSHKEGPFLLFAECKRRKQEKRFRPILPNRRNLPQTWPEASLITETQTPVFGA